MERWVCDGCGDVTMLPPGAPGARGELGPRSWFRCACGGRCWLRAAAAPDAHELRVRLAAVRGIAKRALASGDVDRMGIALLAIQTSGELADCLDAEREAS